MYNKTQKRAVYLLVVLIFVEIIFFLSVFTNVGVNFRNNLAAILPSVLVKATNEERQTQELPELVENPLLVEAAKLKAEDMAAKGYFAHINQEGQFPWHYLDLVGYKYSAAGENLAVNFVQSREVHRAWMNSPTHKANIVEEKFSEIGIATAEGIYKGEEAVFVVQFFGTPKSNLFKNSDNVAVSESINLGNINTNVLGASIFKDNSPYTMILIISVSIIILILIALILKFFVPIKIHHKKTIIDFVIVVIIILLLSIVNLQVVNFVKGEV